MTRFGADLVRGEVIGDIETRKYYTFHRKDGSQFGSGLFDNDKECETHVKKLWPETSVGGSMRCHWEGR